MRRGLIIVLGWAVAASSATAVSVAAVDFLGEGITGQPVQPLSPVEVERELSRATATATPAASPSESERSASASPGPPGGVTRVLTVDGGSVVATCAGTQVTVRSWSPDQGFSADIKDRGPDSTASIEFESDDEEYEVEVTCDDSGTPVARTADDDGNRGPDDDENGGRGDDD